MGKLSMYVYAKFLIAKQAFLEEERGAVDIVAIVVMIGIAVLLAVFFRTQIEGVMEILFGKIQTQAGNAIDGV